MNLLEARLYRTIRAGGKPGLPATVRIRLARLSAKVITEADTVMIFWSEIWLLSHESE